MKHHLPEITKGFLLIGMGLVLLGGFLKIPLITTGLDAAHVLIVIGIVIALMPFLAPLTKRTVKKDPQKRLSEFQKKTSR